MNSLRKMKEKPMILSIENSFNIENAISLI